MTPAQGERLWDSAAAVAPGGAIVEIGSYRGKSAVVMASAAAPWFLRLTKRARPYLRPIERVLGALLVVTGILFVTGSFREIGIWLYNTFPWLQLG